MEEAGAISAARPRRADRPGRDDRGVADVPAPSSLLPAGARGPAVRRVTLQLVSVVAASLVLGGATSFLQLVLPEALSPFANSASGWTLLTALLVAACRARTAPSALYGAASFVALVLGYQVVSTLRGFPTSEELFLVIGVLAGPVVGVAASWLRRPGWRAALGAGVLGGIALGECAYGLVLVLASTGWVYWTLIGAAGLALLGAAATRPAQHGHRLLAVAVGIVVAVLFFFAYAGVGLL